MCTANNRSKRLVMLVAQLESAQLISNDELFNQFIHALIAGAVQPPQLVTSHVGNGDIHRIKVIKAILIDLRATFNLMGINVKD